MDKNKILDTKIIHETANFKVGVSVHPHVSREEGGHLWIMGKKIFQTDMIYHLKRQQK